MTEKEIEQINKFVDLKDIKSNKHMIKVCIFLIVVFFEFFVSLKSCWIVFLVFAIFIIGWGIYLLHTLDKHQIEFFLFWGVSGIYYTAEFFSLGISLGRNVAHIYILLLIILILLDIPMLLILLWYRIQVFNGKREIKSGPPNYRIMIPGMFIFSTVLMLIFKNASTQIQPAIMATMCIFIGYAESIHISFFGNYYIARKYKEHIHLYKT